MTTECIHGLETSRCDLCSPRKAPPAQARPPRAAVQRKAAPLSTTRPVVVDTGARRIFHVTHRRNLPGILTAGRVLSDVAGAHPVVDISAMPNREVRRELSTGSATVAAFVPFFLAPDAFQWEGIRNGDADFRLADSVSSMAPSDFIMLVSSARAGGEGAVVADGDAADSTTRFSSLAELGGRIPRRPGLDQHRDDEDALRSAEFLVPGEFPFTAVTLIGVANDKVRSEVRALLVEHGFGQKVSVYPPWFQRP